jgi:hypothetical protein
MTDTNISARRGRGKPVRYTRAEAERILGRPCPHPERQRDNYCRWCANYAAHRQIRARRLSYIETLFV